MSVYHIVSFLAIPTFFSLLKLSSGSSLLCYSGSETKSIKNVKCDNNVTHCYFSRSLENDTSLKFNSHSSEPVYNRSCDISGICKTVNKTEENKLIEISDKDDKVTQLYCCSKSNCNVPVIAPTQRKCYNVINRGNLSEGLEETCQHLESRCMSIMIPMENETSIQFFSCEQDMTNITACDGVKTKDLKCQNITYRGIKSTVCCCYGDFCTKPSFNYTASVSLISLTNYTSIWIEGNSPRPHTTEAYTDWLFNGGLIAAGVLIVLIIVGSFVIAMKCKKKKETNRMTLAYRRIAADSTPDDDEDIKMLLG